MNVTPINVYLVNKGPSVGVGLQKHTGPELWVSAAHQVTGQTLEQWVLIAHLSRTIKRYILCFMLLFGCTKFGMKRAVFVGKHTNIDELLVALSSLIGHTGQVRVSFLAVFPHHTTVVVRVFPQEAFWMVVAVDVDLGQGIVGSWLLTALVDTRLQPWQQQLQSAEERLLKLNHLKLFLFS